MKKRCLTSVKSQTKTAEVRIPVNSVPIATYTSSEETALPDTFKENNAVQTEPELTNVKTEPVWIEHTDQLNENANTEENYIENHHHLASTSYEQQAMDDSGLLNMFS